MERCSSLEKCHRVLAYILRWKGLNTLSKEPLTATELEVARVKWIKWVQLAMKEDLEKSVCKLETSGKKKVQGRYNWLAPFHDKDGTWRVGGRLRMTIPYTQDNQPEVLLPLGSRYTMLAMLQAHISVEATVVQFRSDGHWTVRAGHLGKMIRGKCVVCRYLDRPLLGQRMGIRKMEFSDTPKVWQQVQVDLMGPFKCRGDKNPRVMVKVWGAVF